MAAESPSQTPDLLFADALVNRSSTVSNNFGSNNPGLSSARPDGIRREDAAAFDHSFLNQTVLDQIAGHSEQHRVLAEYEVVGMMPPQPGGTAFRARHRVTGNLGELRFFPGPDMPGGTRDRPGSSVVPGSETGLAQAQSAHAPPIDATGDAARQSWRQAIMEWNQALSALQLLQNQPNIQRVNAYGEIAGGYYVLLQAVEGRSLRQILKDEGARPLVWTLALAAQVAQALDYAAGLGLAHGDLNPDTIVLYGEPPIACLREFGLGSLNRKTISAYTSPEQTLGNPPDPRSDIYAFGTLLYACLSARPPFGGRSREELCRSIQTMYPPPLLEQPVWARNVLARAMQHSPAYRYRLAVDLVTDLQFQRSPAPIALEPRAPGSQEDENWTLGRDIPAMALMDDEALAAPPVTDARKTGLLTRRLGRAPANTSQNAPRLTLIQQIGRSLRRSQGKTPLQAAPDALAGMPASGIEGADVPIHGFLGRFNRYMALQQYVTLPPDDPRKRGWRGLLLKAGIAWPLPKAREPHSALFRLPAPLVRALNAVWRVTRALVPLAFVAVCAHALMLAHTRRFVHVSDVRGRPIMIAGGVKTPLHAGDTLDAANLPEIQTGDGGQVTLQAQGVWLNLAPNSDLKLTRMGYSPARARRLQLLAGSAWLDIAPPVRAADSLDSEDGADMLAGRSSRLDIEAGDTIARMLPDGGPTLLQITIAHGRTQVKTLAGQTRVTAGRTTRAVKAGQQFAQGKDGAAPHVTPLGSADSKTLRGGFDPSLLDSADTAPLLRTAQARALAAGWRGLCGWYQSAQERLVMPCADAALTLLHLKPGTQDALQEARAYTSARIALDAITKSLAMDGELPAALNLQTLADTGLEPKDRARLLLCFEGKRLLAYKRLENGGCLLLGRVNNDARTLLMARDGVVTRVPEAQEDAELAKADALH